MAAVVKEVRLIMADVDSNANKAWHGYLYDNGDVKVEWGRVGYNMQSKLHPGAGSRKLDSLKASKLKKGYTEQRTVAASASAAPKSVAKNDLKSQAVRDIGGCAEVQSLVAWLAEVNIHKIVANTSITYNESSGTFTTPLGLVTLDGILDARNTLNEMASFAQNRQYNHPEFKRLANAFLNIVPQNIGMKRPDVQLLFGSQESLTKQFDLLDSLDASLQQAQSAPPKQDKAAKQAERVFEVKLDIVQDGKVIDKVKRRYLDTRGNHYDVRDLLPKRVFSVQIPTIHAAFEKDGKKVGGIQQLWHGTSAANLLSILKVGLVIPPSTASFCTGRAFGDGVYFSDQSTKSLRYATGAWGQSKTSRIFMFLADVAMGKPYIAKSMMHSARKAPDGYDSVWCKPNSVFLNDERIVYRTSQVDLVHLIEFSKGGR